MRTKINLLNVLTTEEKDVIDQLREEGCNFLAAAVETCWKDGRSFYIDSRVPVSADLRRQFDRLNIQFD